MKEYWIFTFGSDQLYEGKAVKIAGNWRMARAKMCESTVIIGLFSIPKKNGMKCLIFPAEKK